jgi:hypothetical protein
MSLYSNPRSQQGEISHQATVVIQCTHDKQDIQQRVMAEKDDKNMTYGQATLDLATCRIDRGDLVFTKGTSVVPRGNLLNGAPPVTSFLNGLYWKRTNNMPSLAGLSDKEKKLWEEKFLAKKISDSIRFMGVSLGATVPNPEDEADQKTQITVRTQGTMAIHHNGRSNLQPGDTLLWKVPTSDDEAHDPKRFDGKSPLRFGRSLVKKTLMTVPMRKEHESLEDALLKKMKFSLGVAYDKDAYKKKLMDHSFEIDAFAESVRQALTIMYLKGKVNLSTDYAKKYVDPNSDDFGKTPAAMSAMRDLAEDVKDDTDTANLVKELAHSFIRVLLDLERRKVGKVLSYARPGEKVDVLLGSG